MTSRAAPRPRGVAVVRAVVDATLEELARGGYGGLSIDEVAARAGVNKTTVYRRWPTKPVLVRAALAAFAEGAPPLVETGDVHRDLLSIARRTRDVMASREGRGLLRMILGGCAEPDLVDYAVTLRRQFEAPARRVLLAARARGALAPDLDPGLLLGTLGGWILHMLLREQAEVDDAALARFTDLLLRGAARQTEARSRSASSASGEAASTSGGSRRSANSAKSEIPSSPSTT